MRRRSIQFIVLACFSTTGGIEKFNRAFMKALVQLQQPLGFTAGFAGMYDTGCDERYVPTESFRAYGGRRILFVISTVLRSFLKDELIIGHLNMAMIGVLYKLLRPKGTLTVICHGIEVFEPVNGVKKKVLQKADRLLAVSSYTKQQLVEQQGMPAGKISVFPNTLDPYFKLPTVFEKPAYLKKRYGIRDDEKIIFTLTRLNSNEGYKGYDKLVAALQSFKQKNTAFKYLLAGKADVEEEQRMRRMISDCGLEKQVIMTGFIPDEEVTDHYLLADVFAMPSKGEGFGIVYLEAMACGLPVIAGNKDGSTEALQFGKLGTLIDPDNEEQLLQALEHVLQQEKRPAELQKNMLEYFSFERFTSRLKQIIQPAINSGRVM